MNETRMNGLQNILTYEYAGELPQYVPTVCCFDHYPFTVVSPLVMYVQSIIRLGNASYFSRFGYFTDGPERRFA
jgi:hypothetical protein